VSVFVIALLLQDLHELPEEVVREIILKLNHHFDLNNLSSSSELFKRLIGEGRVWREMCGYHFTDDQVTKMIESQNGIFTWEEIYHKLKR
jgi:F-box protein 25/32